MKKLFTFISGITFVVFSFTSFAVEIKFAHFYDPVTLKSNADWVKETIRVFEANNPGITVKEEIYKWNEIDTKAMMDFKAGIGHDVMLSSPQLMPKHGFVGDYMDLTKYVNSWPDKDDFTWSPVWGKSNQNGKQIGIPTGAHTRTIAFNRKMFLDAGLDPDNPPRTLDQLLVAAKKLTKDTDGDGKTDVWGLAMAFPSSRATPELYSGPLIWHFGGKLWDPESKRATFASAEGVLAIQWLSDLVNVHKVTPKYSIGGDYGAITKDEFLNGKHAMAWGYGSYWIEAMEKHGWTSGIFPASTKGRALEGDYFILPTNGNAMFTNAWCISIHKLSKHPDESFKFIETFLSSDRLRTYPDAGLPGRKSEWDKPEHNTPIYNVWKDAIAKGRPMPSTGYYGELADALAAAIQEILATNASVEDTLKKYEDEWNSNYAGE